MLKKVLFLCICLASLFSEDRRPLKNYITGDAFRGICDFRYENKKTESWLDPTPKVFFEMQKERILKTSSAGDLIFVQSGLLDQFFLEVHPKISHPYILVSHNGDSSVGEKYRQYLDDEKIIKWFAQNVDLEHAKIFAIPIGLENRYWMQRRMSSYTLLDCMIVRENKRDEKVYLNINSATYPLERRNVVKLFSKKPFVVMAGKRKFEDYLVDLKKYAFCFSPSGNGIDCHRTWEALLMGSIPIVRPHVKQTGKSAKGNVSLYEDLPVLVVNEWSEVTEAFLSQKLDEFQQSEFNMEKIYFPYWKDLILAEADIYKQNL